MHNLKMQNWKEATEILEISFICLYLLIHAIKDVVRITEYSFNVEFGNLHIFNRECPYRLAYRRWKKNRGSRPIGTVRYY